MENFKIKNTEGISYLQFTKLLEYEDHLKHLISLKPIDIGNNDNFYKKQPKIYEEYEKICRCINLDCKNVYRPIQTHTDKVKCIKDEKAGIFTDDLKNIDALVTNKKNKILSISVADCIDLLFFDPVKKVIANTHSGWKGTYKLIAENTVDNMVDKYGSNTKNIICCIGPSIRKCHFEVDEDVAMKFYEKFEYLFNIDDIISKGEIKEKKQKYNIDTALINKTVLLEKGLKEENIVDCGLCTVCNSKLFHSYRVDKEKAGRNTGIISLV